MDTLLPRGVIEAFIRDDVMRSYEALPPGKPFETGTVFLRDGVEPVVGAYLKVQVACEPEWNKEFKQRVTGCLMGGRVREVRADGVVVAVIGVTSMPAPEYLECEWDVELVFDRQCKYPWVVRSMRPRQAN